MATYIVLINYTEQGVANMKESPSRLDASREAIKAMGGELKGFYLTMGRYDAIVVVELPDGASVAKLALATGAQGNIRTETLQAFPEDEYRQIIAALP